MSEFYLYNVRWKIYISWVKKIRLYILGYFIINIKNKENLFVFLEIRIVVILGEKSGYMSRYEGNFWGIFE